jgi:hypothetical protein
VIGERARDLLRWLKDRPSFPKLEFDEIIRARILRTPPSQHENCTSWPILSTLGDWVCLSILLLPAKDSLEIEVLCIRTVHWHHLAQDMLK